MPHVSVIAVIGVFGAAIVLAGIVSIACVMARMTMLWREHRYASFVDGPGGGQQGVSLQKVSKPASSTHQRSGSKRGGSAGDGGASSSSSSSSSMPSWAMPAPGPARRTSSGDEEEEVVVDVALGPPVVVPGLDIEAQAACH